MFIEIATEKGLRREWRKMCARCRSVAVRSVTAPCMCHCKQCIITWFIFLSCWQELQAKDQKDSKGLYLTLMDMTSIENYASIQIMIFAW